jgi:hypothetical protein
MKCGFCGRESSTGWGRFCSEECRIKEAEFMKLAEEKSKIYLILVLVPLLLMIPGVIFIDYAFILFSIPLFISGAVIIKYPFTTPETVEMMGLKKSISFAKGCGVMLILMGIVLFFLFYPQSGLIK